MRQNSVVLICLLSVAVLIWSSPAVASTPEYWDLASELRAAPDQANPNPDGLGNAGVWSFLESAGLTHDPAGYSLLDAFTSDWLSVPGLECWQPDPDTAALPMLCLNARADDPFPLGIDWPAGSVLAHPSPDRLAVVGWRSPITGRVQISGGVIDRHSTCGDGIDWSIDRGNSTVVSGVIPNGAAQTFSSASGGAGLESLRVTAGETLYFTVGPGPNGEHTCDSTGLDITIRPQHLRRFSERCPSHRSPRGPSTTSVGRRIAMTRRAAASGRRRPNRRGPARRSRHTYATASPHRSSGPDHIARCRARSSS